MYQRYISFEAVVDLIKQGGFGAYLVYYNPTGELLFASHSAGTEKEDAMKTEDLIEDLSNKIAVFGHGVFKILLKRNNKTQNANAVVYRFEIRLENSDAAVQMTGMAGPAGFTYEAMKAEMQNEVSKALTHEREKFEHEKKLWELERQIAELKNQKGGDQMAGMAPFMELGKMVMGIVVAKVAPESVPMINSMLGNMAASEQEETPRPVQRTD